MRRKLLSSFKSAVASEKRGGFGRYLFRRQREQIHRRGVFVQLFRGEGQNDRHAGTLGRDHFTRHHEKEHHRIGQRQRIQWSRKEKVGLDEVLSADECFCTGTAVVVVPVGSVTHRGKKTVFCDGKIGATGQMLYDELTGIQQGRLKDTKGWIEHVRRITTCKERENLMNERERETNPSSARRVLLLRLQRITYIFTSTHTHKKRTRILLQKSNHLSLLLKLKFEFK